MSCFVTLKLVINSKKLEQEMVKLIGLMKPKYRDLIVDRVQERYQIKGVFESFSKEFFKALLLL
jgi:hypothetical protein